MNTSKGKYILLVSNNILKLSQMSTLPLLKGSKSIQLPCYMHCEDTNACN